MMERPDDRISKDTFPRRTRLDPRNVELPDEASVAMYRAKSGPEKLRILDAMYRSAVKLARGGVLAEHPDWTPAQVEREVGRRIYRGAV